MTPSCCGKRINVSLADQQLTQDFLEIPLADGKTRIIAFQDLVGKSGEHTAESKTTIEIVNATMKFN
ncbi:MAG TPA: hypothetical protein VNS58_19000 [Puia sp.]|nr:hypothetical protein [Puia sp.]